MTPEQSRQLNFLAGNPQGLTTMKDSDIETLLLETGGNMLACGSLYDFVVTPIGAGVSKVTLKLTNP